MVASRICDDDQKMGCARISRSKNRHLEGQNENSRAIPDLSSPKMTFEQKIHAAEGYAELEMYDDALAELDELDSDHQDRLETLRVRMEVILRKRDWKTALRFGLRTCQLYPNVSCGFIHSAFCLHELGRTKEAKQMLLDGPATLLDEPVYYYNLGCYDAVLGNLNHAKAYLRVSFRLDESFRDLAKNDPDLERIRDEL
jgi:predicted Zn-dependent protease